VVREGGGEVWKGVEEKEWARKGFWEHQCPAVCCAVAQDSRHTLSECAPSLQREAVNLPGVPYTHPLQQVVQLPKRLITAPPHTAHCVGGVTRAP
jgi:hypothetical protein